MPFGKKLPTHDVQIAAALPSRDRKIAFDRVYGALLKPALQKAGYDAARADSAAKTGDVVRTDLFFELVTADFVVADISILNARIPTSSVCDTAFALAAPSL